MSIDFNCVITVDLDYSDFYLNDTARSLLHTVIKTGEDTESYWHLWMYGQGYK